MEGRILEEEIHTFIWGKSSRETRGARLNENRPHILRRTRSQKKDEDGGTMTSLASQLYLLF